MSQVKCKVDVKPGLKPVQPGKSVNPDHVWVKEEGFNPMYPCLQNITLLQQPAGVNDSKAKVLQRVKRDTSPSFMGDCGDNSVRGIKRALTIMKGSETENEEKESEKQSEEEVTDEKKTLPDIPASLPDEVKMTFPFPTVTEEKRKAALSRWKKRWEGKLPLCPLFRHHPLPPLSKDKAGEAS